MVEFSSATQVIQAYRNSLIDAAALSLDEALLLLESGENFKILLVMDFSNGGDAIIGQADISSLAEISGKRIGAENNALGAFMLSRALEYANIDNKSINIISLDANHHEAAFKLRKIDAVVTFEPVRSRLLEANGKILFDSSHIPGEIVDVLIIRDEYLHGHQHKVRYLIDEWFKALDYIKQQPRKAAKLHSFRMKLDVDSILSSYDGLSLPNREEHRKLLKHPDPMLHSTMNKLMRAMIDQGLINKTIDTNSVFTDLNQYYADSL